MKTLSVRFVDGPLDGQSRDLAVPPVKFELYQAGNDGFVIDEQEWPNKDIIGYYGQDSISEALGYAVFVWVPCEHVPGCLKPLDAIEFASRHERFEPRRFAVAYVDEEGKIQWAWHWPEEK
jgi:hypothetical protein